MFKFDNYVFFSICEYSLQLYEGSHYSRYRLFCHAIKNIIHLGNYDKKDTERIFAICGHLMLLYGFGIEEAMRYVGRYFNEEQYIQFEIPTRNIKESFPSGFN